MCVIFYKKNYIHKQNHIVLHASAIKYSTIYHIATPVH